MPIIVGAPDGQLDSVRTELVAAAISALANVEVPAYEIDDLKEMDALPADYAEVHLSTRTPGPGRLAARGRRFGWRLQIRVNGQSMGNANVLIDRVHSALYDVVLMAAGRATTRTDKGPMSPPEEDDGYYSGLVEFTFTH